MGDTILKEFVNFLKVKISKLYYLILKKLLFLKN